jgi:hypothetical protein
LEGFSPSGWLESINRVVRFKAAARRVVMAAISATLAGKFVNGPVAQLQMSTVLGCVNVPTPGKARRPLTIPHSPWELAYSTLPSMR